MSKVVEILMKYFSLYISNYYLKRLYRFSYGSPANFSCLRYTWSKTVWKNNASTFHKQAISPIPSF